MGRMVPEGVTEFQEIDPGIYGTVIETAEEKTHEENQKLYFQVQFRVTEPTERAGTLRTEYFRIGSDEDPQAQNPQTWKNAFGASRLKVLCKKVGVPFDNQDTDVIMASLLGNPVMIEVERKMDKKGIMWTNTRQFHSPGERQPFIKPHDDGATAAAPQPPQAPVQQQYVQPAAPVQTMVPPTPQQYQQPAGGNGQVPPQMVPPAPPQAAPQGGNVPPNPPAYPPPPAGPGVGR